MLVATVAQITFAAEQISIYSGGKTEIQRLEKVEIILDKSVRLRLSTESSHYDLELASVVDAVAVKDQIEVAPSVKAEILSRYGIIDKLTIGY